MKNLGLLLELRRDSNHICRQSSPHEIGEIVLRRKERETRTTEFKGTLTFKTELSVYVGLLSRYKLVTDSVDKFICLRPPSPEMVRQTTASRYNMPDVVGKCPHDNLVGIGLGLLKVWPNRTDLQTLAGWVGLSCECTTEFNGVLRMLIIMIKAPRCYKILVY